MKTKVSIGIDVGSKGCIAVISDATTVEKLIDYTNHWADELTLIKHEYDVSMVCMEKVSAMRGQGVTSMFSFGMKVGELHGILNTLGLPYREIRPQEWMKGLGLSRDKKQRKKDIAEIASRQFPMAELYGPQGGLKDGRSDALLIAEYCRRNF